jgi:UDP-N-acetylmuramoyl-tripeptide--D-alanyl-D-alanine ligase
MFKVNELLKATKGKLIQGRPNVAVKGISIDSRTICRGDAFVAIKGNNFDGHNFIKAAIKKGASCILSQRLPFTVYRLPRVVFIKVKDTVKALGDIARLQREKFDLPVIAVTGSNGKTTTKEMIAAILSKKYPVLKNEGTKNNQIGLPLTLLKLKPYHEIVVLELGTNHPGEIEYLSRICQPNIGIITNIGPVHLEFLQSLEGVLKEKLNLIKNLKRPYIAILNADDNLLNRQLVRKSTPPFTLSFGIKKPSDFLASRIRSSYQKIGFVVNNKYRFTLKTLGYQNIYNALSAIAIGQLFGLEYKDVVSGLNNFNFPQSRLNMVKLKGLRFIDDTYNSNPNALKQALEVLDNFKVKGKKIFVMGDMLELGKDKELFHFQAGRLAAGICDIFITVGKLSKCAAQAAKKSGMNSQNIFICDACQKAREILFSKISLNQDDLVLVKGSRLMKMEEVLK